MSAPLLSVRDLRVTFHTPEGPAHAVRGVDFDVHPGEVLGLVGESGSGKSVSLLAAVGLLPPAPMTETGGSVRLRSANGEGTEELLGASDRHLRRVRGRRIGFVFQDPLTSLHPLLTVGRQVLESIRLAGRSVHRGPAKARLHALLQEAGLPDPERIANAYPHELSGGQRQRALIAMALAGDPELLIADEATTALDVTVQAQILELFRRLVRERGMALISVTHDLGVVAAIADRAVVLYGGRVMEEAPVHELFREPRHPYTRGLLASVPGARTVASSTQGAATLAKGDLLPSIPGLPPDPRQAPKGCPFAPRCSEADADCDAAPPAMRHWPGARRAACLRPIQAQTASSASSMERPHPNEGRPS